MAASNTRIDALGVTLFVGSKVRKNTGSGGASGSGSGGGDDGRHGNGGGVSSGLRSRRVFSIEEANIKTVDFAMGKPDDALSNSESEDDGWKAGVASLAIVVDCPGQQVNEIRLKWCDVAAAQLDYNRPPKCSFSLTLEPKEPLEIGGCYVPLLSVTFQSCDISIVETVLLNEGVSTLVPDGIPGFMREPPFVHYYSGRFRAYFSLISDILDLFITFCAIVYTLSAWVGEDNLRFAARGLDKTFVYPVQKVVWKLYAKYPLITGFSMFWVFIFLFPLFMLYGGFIVGGFVLIRYSVVAFLIHEIMMRAPSMIRTLLKAPATVAYYWNCFQWAKGGVKGALAERKRKKAKVGMVKGKEE
eukprot:TRINITY_DN9028_c0_g1_i1.p1 TRINITY_DN9028_c0_g1~~TRINITY_DN9028_c0_g1_i1.p1  ORF type:complete len:358 (+),score=48.93 TRINITY_DN9028_c0_g1_i1:142-1215(+)